MPNDGRPAGADGAGTGGAWTAARLFDVWFRPLYPPDLRDEATAMAEQGAARPHSALAMEVAPEAHARLAPQLDEIAAVFARLAPSALGREEGELALDFSDASVHRLGAALDRRTRDALLAASTPGDPQALFARVVLHGAVYVGACIVRGCGAAWGATWVPRHPLWESTVRLRSRAGEASLAPFGWWLRSLSDAEIDKGGLASRHRQYVERAVARPEELEPIVVTRVDRVLPPLGTVRYDTLHRWLRAHLPELSDLGRDFPTAEELEALGLLELEFLLLGAGRMLLMHGRGKRGLHLIWLDHQGFSHAAFFPATPGDPHGVSVEGDKLVVRFTAFGKERVHEMLWWG